MKKSDIKKLIITAEQEAFLHEAMMYQKGNKKIVIKDLVTLANQLIVLNATKKAITRANKKFVKAKK